LRIIGQAHVEGCFAGLRGRLPSTDVLIEGRYKKVGRAFTQYLWWVLFDG
jgi:hypothetical protein